MYIKRKIVTIPVTISGRDFLGRDSSITFTPHDKPGWWWNTKYHGFIPIDHRIARYKKGRIQLVMPGECINVWEHIGALRYIGIDNVSVSMDHGSWPPYLVAGEYLQYFTDALTEVLEDDEYGACIPAIGITASTDASYSSGNHLLSRVDISRHHELVLSVHSQWKGLPEHNETLYMEILPGAVLRDIFFALPQGLANRKVIAQIASFFGWPHMDRVAWPDTFHSKEQASYAFWLHRVQDILGETSLVDHKALPWCKFYSFMAGHNESLHAIKKAFA